MNEEQLLRDAGIEPTSEIIAEGLGAAAGAYTEFLKGLERQNIQVNWRYYRDGKAWLGKGLYTWATSRGTEKVMTVFWLSIWTGFFKVSIFIPEKARADVLSLSLNNKTKKAIENSPQIGKLKFFPMVFDLSSDELFDDIFTLVKFKKTIK